MPTPGSKGCEMSAWQSTVMILMLTAANAPTGGMAGLALGADDHPPEAFLLAGLVLRVRALGRPKPTSKRRALRGGNRA
jgi:DNA-binding response OmpR family regulator